MHVHGKYTLPVWFNCFQYFLEICKEIIPIQKLAAGLW